MQCDTLKKKILNSKTIVNDIVPVVKKYSNKEMNGWKCKGFIFYYTI